MFKKPRLMKSIMAILLFILLLSVTGLSLSINENEVRPAILSKKSCFLEDIIFLNPSYCSDIEGNTVRHLGSCSVEKLSNDGFSEVLTCIHGHWSGTQSSIGNKHHREKRFWGFVVAAAVAGAIGGLTLCVLFCGGDTQVITKYPPSFSDPCKPDDVKDNYNVAAGETNVVVRWTTPKATDRDGNIQSVAQVGGGKNGGRFEGANYGKTHYIVYRATDSDGLTGHCYFSFTVTILTCGVPPWPTNGARSCENNNILGSSCQYTCYSGYQLIGSATVTCQNGGMPTWSAIPTCEKITCRNPSTPEHSTLQCTDTTYTYQIVCSILCAKGFSLTGPVYMQCRADGTWENADRSTCKDATPPSISCITPQIFHADRGLTSTIVKWQLPTANDKTDPNPTIVQTEGPTLASILDVGIDTVKYKAVDVDGNESPECFIELRVEEIICGHPMDSFQDNYLIFNCSTPRYSYGTSCLLSCSAHLPLEGTNLVTCEKTNQSVGVWTWDTVDKPYCREIACPELQAPINGAIVYDTIQTRPIYTMMCNKNFDIPDMGTNFNGMFFCTDDGDWKPDPPVPDCTETRNPQYLNLPAEIFYYEGDCGSADAMADIEENFKNILNSELNPYFKIICPSGETCMANNINITCGPIPERHERSLEFDYENEDLYPGKGNITAYTRERSIHKRSTHTYLLIFKFDIVVVLKLDNTSLRDALPIYNHIQMNILKPAVREMINNGTFDVQGFVLRSDSFKTDSYGEIACDSGYILDSKTCKPCPVGYFLNETVRRCELCPVGHFRDNDSDISCTSCPTGYSTRANGSKSQDDCKQLCSPGSYSPDTMVFCSPCLPGFYQEEYGQVSCKACPSGKTTISANSNSFNDCKDFDIFLDVTNRNVTVSTIPSALSAFTFMFWSKGFDEKFHDAMLRLANRGTPLISVYLTENIRVEIPSQIDEIVGTHSSSSWNHVAVTWNSIDSRVHVYLAGRSVYISDTVNVTSAPLLENGTFEIASSGQTGVYLSGLHLLGKVLTEMEIANHALSCHISEHDDLINMGVFSDYKVQGVSRLTPSICNANDPCLSSPCNGHVCINGQEGFTCICHGGWSGTTCTVQPDLCINNGCENNAACSSGNTNYTCICIPGYSGAFCEVPPVNGGWSEWTSSACSRSCGSGTINRTRRCDSPPPDAYGADCIGDQIEMIPCNVSDCPVCKEFGKRYGTLLNCTTDQLSGSKTCILYCEKDKFLPPGLTEFQTYTCGPGTNYVWDSLDNPPSCVDPVGPGDVNITANVNYTTTIPDDVTKPLLDIIGDQISSVPCFNSPQCQTSATLTQSTLSVTFNIRLLLGPDVQYGVYVSSGIASGALTELIDVLTYLESSAQYIKNNTNELFDVFVEGVMYTVNINSLTFGARVTCSDGYVALNGFCVACPPGTYSANGVCNFCEKGTYQTNQGQISCLPCPDGLLTSTIGSSNIVQCKEIVIVVSTSKKPPVQAHEDNKTTVYIAFAMSTVALIVALSVLGIVLYKKRRSSPGRTDYEDIMRMDCRNYSQLDGTRSNMTPSVRSCIQNGSDEFMDSFKTPEVSNGRSSPPPPYEVPAVPQNIKHFQNGTDNGGYLTPIGRNGRSCPPPPHKAPAVTSQNANSSVHVYDIINDNYNLVEV